MSETPLTMKEFLPDEQPQEKAERHGIGALSLAELWAVILRAGQPGVPIITLTREMMRANDGKLRILERRSRQELMTIPGIGRVKALQIEAVLEIMRRYNVEKMGERVRIRCAEDIYNYMCPIARQLEYEKIWIICLTNSNSVIGCTEVSSGGMTATVFDLKKVLKYCILTQGCTSVIMCHNHPSGLTTPSPQDDNITSMLSKGCNAVGLKMLDHVIVAGDNFYSYADNGRL